MFVSAMTAYTSDDHSSVVDSAANDKVVVSPAAGQVEQTDTSAVLVTLSLIGLDFLKRVSSDSDAALSAQQEAVIRLDQIIQSGRHVAKEAAEEGVNMLNAQMRLLMEMKTLLSPKALALEVADLIRFHWSSRKPYRRICYFPSQLGKLPSQSARKCNPRGTPSGLN